MLLFYGIAEVESEKDLEELFFDCFGKVDKITFEIFVKFMVSS